MRGELSYEPQSAYGGASFRLDLPVASQSARRLSEATTAPGEAAPAPHARLLVVDDEADVASLMRDMLEGAGYDVATAESGAVALELLDAARFDALLSDLRMPEMDGPALWNAVVERHPRLSRRMVFVTGDTLSADARQFLPSSGCSSLEKPFSKVDSLSRISAALR